MYLLSFLRVLFPRSNPEALPMKLLHLRLALRSFQCQSGSLVILVKVVDVGPYARNEAPSEESTNHARPISPKVKMLGIQLKSRYWTPLAETLYIDVYIYSVCIYDTWPKSVQWMKGSCVH
jgi:hypothetical protein